MRESSVCDSIVPMQAMLREINLASLADAGLGGAVGLCAPFHVRMVWLANSPKLTDAGLFHLATLPNLEQLHLFSCEQVTGSGLTHLTRLKNLR